MNFNSKIFPSHYSPFGLQCCFGFVGLNNWLCTFSHACFDARSPVTQDGFSLVLKHGMTLNSSFLSLQVLGLCMCITPPPPPVCFSVYLILSSRWLTQWKQINIQHLCSVLNNDAIKCSGSSRCVMFPCYSTFRRRAGGTEVNASFDHVGNLRSCLRIKTRTGGGLLPPSLMTRIWSSAFTQQFWSCPPTSTLVLWHTCFLIHIHF